MLYFPYKMHIPKSANGRVRDDQFMVGSKPSAIVNDASSVFSARFPHVLECHFSCQAQYLVRLEG